MNGNVMIKSFPNGISVKLSDKPGFKKILEDTKQSFEKTASFFKDASIVLRFDGRILSDEEIGQLTDVIKKACQLNIICVVCTNQEENVYFSKLLEEARQEEQPPQASVEVAEKPSNQFQFYKGNLKDGVSFESEGNVLVMGDVQKGAAIFAKGNVIILGTVYGTVFAGKSGDENRFIAALGFLPEHLKIGNIKYKPDIKDKITFNKKQPKIAYIKNSKFTFSDLDFTKELPDYNF